MIESISAPNYIKPPTENVQKTEDSSPKVDDTGNASRVNGIKVSESSESKGGENSSQRHDDPSSQQGNGKANLSLDSLVTAQSAKSSTSQPQNSTYEAAQQEQSANSHNAGQAPSDEPSYANTDISA